MPRLPSPKRYAQAVFEIAAESGEFEVWQEDLRILASAVEQEEFAAMLDAPQVPAQNKVALVKEALGDTVGPLAMNLMSLLSTNGLVSLLPGIVDEYAKLMDEHNGIERAEVVSAVPLDDNQKDQVADILQQVVGKDVRVASYVDPQILGGMVARLGDRVIDGSVRTKLADMRRDLVKRR